jgi:membrane protein DedA with SNARE-associated domain
MAEVLIQFIDQYGLLAFTILMFFNNATGLIPGGIVSLAAGSFAYLTDYNLINTIMATTIGSIAGAFFLYILGRLFGYNWLLKVRYVEKFITKRELDLIAEKLRFDGAHWVCIFRFLPSIGLLVSLPAGMIRMPAWVFFFYTTIGILGWALIWQIPGYYVGLGFAKYGYYISGLLFLVSIYFLFVFKKILQKIISVD